MKKINKIVLLLFIFGAIFTVNTKEVEAASFSVSSSASSVSSGGKVTVTIKASDCGGQFSVSASGGAKVSSSSVWIESGSSSVTVTAPSSGSFTVTVTASDVANSAGTAAVTGSKSVSVSVKASSSSSSSGSSSSSSSSSSSGSSSSSNSNTSTPAEPVETKSKVNTLSKLSVDKGSLSPTFAEGTTSYKVSVTDETEITISATAKDSKASVSGAGKKELKSGTNSFSVVVTAEDGSKKTYTIEVMLKVSPTVFTSVGDSNLGVVAEPYTVSIPNAFESTTTMMGEDEITAWSDENSGLVIVCLVGEDEEETLYVMEDGEIISLFRSMAVLGQNVYVLDVVEEEQARMGMEYTEVEIDGQLMPGWSFEEEALAGYALVRLTQHNGEVIEYLYSESDNTMISFDVEAFMNVDTLTEATENVESLTATNNDLKSDLSNMEMIAIVTGVLAGLTTLGAVVSMSLGRGYKKDYLKVKELMNGGSSMEGDFLDENATIEEDFIDCE